MATMVILDFPGGTTDQYEQVVEKMELGGKVAPGGISHVMAPTDDGFRVVDVWESPEVFQQFADEKIVPLTQEAGLPQPQIQTLEAHNYLTQ